MLEQDRGTRLYTRREFGVLALKAAAAGAGVALGASLPEIKAARSDGGAVTQPERFPGCEYYSHLKNNPEVKIDKTHFIVDFFFFPDQPEGVRFFEANISSFNRNITEQFGWVQEFFSQYLPDFRSTLEIRGRRLMTKVGFQEHREREIAGLAVDYPEDFFNLSYNKSDGKYPVYCRIYVTNPNLPRRNTEPYPGTRGDIGAVYLPWHLFFVEYYSPGSPFPYETFEIMKRKVQHEVGHAFGMPHNPNGRSIMVPSGGWRPEGFVLDATDLEGIISQRCRVLLPLIQRSE